MSKHIALTIYYFNVYKVKLLCYRLTGLYILYMLQHFGMANVKIKKKNLNVNCVDPWGQKFSLPLSVLRTVKQF